MWATWLRLVREDALELLLGQPAVVQQGLGDAQDRVLAVAAGQAFGKRVAIATRGCMLASAHSRSTTPCSSACG